MCIVRHRGCTPLIPTLGVLCESEASLVFIKSSPEGRTFPPHTCFEASISGGCACEKILEHRSGPQHPKACVFFPKPHPFLCCGEETGQVFANNDRRLHQGRGLIWLLPFLPFLLALYDFTATYLTMSSLDNLANLLLKIVMFSYLFENFRASLCPKLSLGLQQMLSTWEWMLSCCSPWILEWCEWKPIYLTKPCALGLEICQWSK